MAIDYKDFFPTVLKSGFFSNEYELLPDIVARADAWIAENGVRVINVETVVLPNVNLEEGISSAVNSSSGDVATLWCQVIRVWYETPNSLS